MPNLVKAHAMGKGNFAVYIDGVHVATCQKVKVPKITHGVVSHHPGGAPHAIKASAGYAEYDNLELTQIIAEDLPQTELWAWMNTSFSPLLGLGAPTALIKRNILVVAITNFPFPKKSWMNIGCFPVEREVEEFEGGSEDMMADKIVFSVDRVDEIPT